MQGRFSMNSSTVWIHFKELHSRSLTFIFHLFHSLSLSSLLLPPLPVEFVNLDQDWTLRFGTVTFGSCAPKALNPFYKYPYDSGGATLVYIVPVGMFSHWKIWSNISSNNCKSFIFYKLKLFLFPMHSQAAHSSSLLLIKPTCHTRWVSL